MDGIAMDYIYEWIEAAEKYCNQDIDLLLYMLQEMSENTKDKKFYKALESKIGNICREHQLCPECFTVMKINYVDEYRGDYHGHTVTEKIMTNMKCPNCGVTIE